jgi:hypothetical protein
MGDSKRQQIAAVCKQLGDVELEVVYMTAARLLAGQPVYGKLDLETDKRDFMACESLEELADAGHYMCLELQRAIVRLKKSAALDPPEVP